MLNFSNDFLLIGWVVGFVDGEGCFSVSFSRKATFTTGIEVRPSFSISQNARSKASVEAFLEYFECGFLRFSKSDGTWKYETRDLTEILEKVVPFFKKYPLKTSKKQDFELFVEICFKMKRNEHRSFVGLEEILRLAYQMNISGKRKLKLSEQLTFLLNHRNHPNNLNKQ